MIRLFCISFLLLLVGCTTPQQSPPIIMPPGVAKATVAAAVTNSPTGFRVATSSGQVFTVFCQSSNEWMQVSPDLKNWKNFSQLIATVRLGWNPSTDTNVVGYNIYWGGATGVYTNHIPVDGINSSNAAVSSLIEGTTYYFTATCTGAMGLESPFSSEVAYTIPIVAPKLNIIKP